METFPQGGIPMKKIYRVLSVALAVGLFGGSLAAAKLKGNQVKKASATGELEYSIEITAESNFFTNWDDPSFVNAPDRDKPGLYKTAGATCWSGSMNVFGTFFDGCNDGYEQWKGTLKSRKWHQTTEWIYFQWGCAKDNNRDNDQAVKLVFHLYEHENDATPYASYDYWNDTFSGCTMVMRNYNIPAQDFEDLNGDFYMSVDLVDGRTGDYGAHEFGNLHVNQTHQQVSDAQWYYYQNCVNAERTVLELRNHFRTNGILRNGFVYSTGFEETFDSQETFNQNWVKDVYGNDTGVRNPDKVISESTYRTGSNMPFNSDDGFFKGWYGGANDDYQDHEFGYVADDGAVYRFISKPFIMPANGIVSVMMAGNSASLHLLDFESSDDLAWVDVKTFVSGGDENPIAKTGKNVCTMVRHIVNFSKYAGRRVQLGIADVDSKEGGWNTAYFEELKANYAELPTLKVDVVTQDKDGLSYAAYNDVYVTSLEVAGGVDYAHNDGPAEDTCALKRASEFVKSYMNLFRNNHDTNRFCSVYTSDDAKALLTTYAGLTPAEQELICKSDDYHRVGATAENWWTVRPTFDLKNGTAAAQKLGYSIEYLARVNGVNGIVTYNSFSPINEMNVTTTVYIVVAVAAVITLPTMLLFILKKRRKQR